MPEKKNVKNRCMSGNNPSKISECPGKIGNCVGFMVRNNITYKGKRIGLALGPL